MMTDLPPRFFRNTCSIPHQWLLLISSGPKGTEKPRANLHVWVDLAFLIQFYNEFSLWFPICLLQQRGSLSLLLLDSLYFLHFSDVFSLVSIPLYVRKLGPWLSLISLKKFRGPRYVADLGGSPLVRKKMKKIYNIGQLFEGKKINFAVLLFKNMFFKTF